MTEAGSLGRVFIANRGEIAIRIARAAAALGMESVGIYAAVDELALHTRYVTKACQIPGAGVDAYLDAQGLAELAAAEGCDCVHPGYGFLAESAAFAEACADRGLTFVGPTPDALRLFGDKVRARTLAQSIDIPTAAGSPTAMKSTAEAAEVAGQLGYPVMLKAAAGGGGRGMRAVADPAEMEEAFDRCSSEAEAAFGDGSLFVETLIPRPRHIEVQVLADRSGHAVHLHERDCSVQLRNQKVVEIAPAPGLDADLRATLHAEALALVRAGQLVNAATVEFLVSPETGAHYFLECNPRVQVEHTVTEQVTGIDIVETQFHLAAGRSLESLGLGDPAAIGAPRGFSIQARVVATGAGTITAYKEPTGPGVRVDACGYLGYSPPPQFDPLLAKVIATSPVGSSLDAAVEKALLALAEFQVGGLPTNLGQLPRILSHADVRAGDARTSLLTEHAELLLDNANAGSPSGKGKAISFLAERAATFEPVVSTPALTVGPGQAAVESPITGSIIDIRVLEGDAVAEGDPVFVVTAMKMETVVRAPASGIVSAVAFGPGDNINAGDIVVLITEQAVAQTDQTAPPAEDEGSWSGVLDEIAQLQQLAHQRLAPGSTDPGVVRQRSRNKLTCRERIDLLLDDGSFREVGSVTGFASYDEEGRIAAFTPSNHVGGSGKIDGRDAVVCADDFTSRGGHSDGAIGAKSLYLDRLATELGAPSIRLLDGSSGGGSVASMVPEQTKENESAAKESKGAITAGRPRVTGGGGSYLPGHLGSTMYTQQLSKVPVVNVLLGSVVGIGAAKAVLGHFSVMVKDIAQLFVAGPPVVRHAMGYDITKEDLGGWHIHCRNGSVDNLAESEPDAIAQVKRFLSYVPANVFEAPPVAAPNPEDPADRREDELFTIIPRKRTTTFDVRRAIELMADAGSFFEIGPLWGTDQVTGLARFDGHPVGVIASDSRHVNGGALTADGCSKLTRHLDLCDLFHLPVLNLVDNPGFAVGLEHEIAGTIRRGGEWMVAFAQTEVPIFTVLMRRSFGVAGNNFATPRSHASVRVAWPAADVGGIPPEGGIEAAYKRQLAEAEDPEALRAELNARIESARGPLGPLSRFQMEEMIDPRDTRAMVCDWVRTAYRVVSRPARLVPRPIQFRP